MKNIRIFYMKIFPFFVVKFSIYLNRRVLVLLGKRELVALHFFVLWLVYCRSRFVCASSSCNW